MNNLEMAEYLGLSNLNLDDDVHDVAGKLAADTNIKGLEAQLEFLAESLQAGEIRQVIKKRASETREGRALLCVLEEYKGSDCQQKTRFLPALRELVLDAVASEYAGYGEGVVYARIAAVLREEAGSLTSLSETLDVPPTQSPDRPQTSKAPQAEEGPKASPAPWLPPPMDPQPVHADLPPTLQTLPDYGAHLTKAQFLQLHGAGVLGGFGTRPELCLGEFATATRVDPTTKVRVIPGQTPDDIVWPLWATHVMWYTDNSGEEDELFEKLARLPGTVV